MKGTIIKLLLTGGACLGTLVTMTFAINAGKKAVQLREEAKEIKGAELTKKESILAQVPALIVPIVSACVTVSFIFGMAWLHKTEQAALMAGITAMQQFVNRYSTTISEKFGDEFNTAVKCAMAEKAIDGRIPVPGMNFYYDPWSDRVYEKTEGDIWAAFYELNERFQTEGGSVNLNTFYDCLNEPRTPIGHMAGWNADMLLTYNYTSQIFCRVNGSKDDDTVPNTPDEVCDKPYYILDFEIQPEFDYNNWEDHILESLDSRKLGQPSSYAVANKKEIESFIDRSGFAP